MCHVQNMSSRKYPGNDGEKKYPDMLNNFSLQAGNKTNVFNYIYIRYSNSYEKVVCISWLSL